MFAVQQITADPNQQQTLILPDGSFIVITIQYKDLCLGWEITSLKYGKFQANGMRICTSPNMLRQFKNIIPFGLCCLTKNGEEPTTIQDFASGRSQLFILTASEVATYEAFLSAN